MQKMTQNQKYQKNHINRKMTVDGIPARFAALKAGQEQFIKDRRRKKFMRKARFTLTITLPVFLTILSVKVIRTYIRIKVRALFSDAEQASVPSSVKQPAPSPSPVPAQATHVSMEPVTCAPVSTPLSNRSE